MDLLSTGITKTTAQWSAVNCNSVHDSSSFVLYCWQSLWLEKSREGVLFLFPAPNGPTVFNSSLFNYKAISETALGKIESVLPHCDVRSSVYTTSSHIILTPGRPD
ncbi:hypothetical protein ElyMa_003986200 [Elysia marginata]|uniref:Uncharacterized protein n=1 Tax=Elysia marginata TaxID=1093978 RepID=A0AAV4FXW4_9GAST|nr:hypothetical protein ElyMa_003986200 [Elysia marginata]